MNKEQQVKFLETLGYTVKISDIYFKLPDGRQEPYARILIAFKGECPKYPKIKHSFKGIFKKESEKLMYNIMMDKIAEETKYLK